MSKKYLKIQKALGSPDALELEADGGRTFTSEEMDSLETALANNSGEELQGQLDTANAGLQTATETIAQRDVSVAELTRQVETANDTIAQRDETIAQLTAENASLRAKPADEGARIIAPVDGDAGTGKAISDGYENPFDALEKVSEEYLGKPINK